MRSFSCWIRFSYSSGFDPRKAAYERDSVLRLRRFWGQRVDFTLVLSSWNLNRKISLEYGNRSCRVAAKVRHHPFLLHTTANIRDFEYSNSLLTR